MKHRTLSIIAGAASLCAAGTCTADFLGISLELVSQQAETGAGPAAGFGPSTTYRIYANFSTPATVVFVYGLESGHVAFFTLCSGSIFNQVTFYGDAQITPPTPAQLAGPAGAGWALDSYYTIGGLAPSFSPGTVDVISTPLGETGRAWTGSWDSATDGEFAWFISPNVAPSGTKILLAQLTVSGMASGGTLDFFGGNWCVQTVEHGNICEGPDDGLTAFHFAIGNPCPGPSPPWCPADLAGNLHVGVSDLLILLAAWGPCDGPCLADLTGDGNVGVADLLELLSAWGPCPEPD